MIFIEPKHAQHIAPGTAAAVVRPKVQTDYVCPVCGSRNVAHDATVRWDFELQRFVLQSIQDFVACQDCGHESDTGHDFFVCKGP